MGMIGTTVQSPAGQIQTPSTITDDLNALLRRLYSVEDSLKYLNGRVLRGDGLDNPQSLTPNECLGNLPNSLHTILNSIEEYVSELNIRL